MAATKRAIRYVVAVASFAADGELVHAGNVLPANHRLVKGRTELFKPAPAPKGGA